ncbi:MAG: hypothetical protein ACRERD_10385 [Candidatus Binatia bacterium]
MTEHPNAFASPGVPHVDDTLLPPKVGCGQILAALEKTKTHDRVHMPFKARQYLEVAVHKKH